MQRRTAAIVGALVFSVVLGVLTGLVLRLGTRVKEAGGPPPPLITVGPARTAFTPSATSSTIRPSATQPSADTAAPSSTVAAQPPVTTAPAPSVIQAPQPSSTAITVQAMTSTAPPDGATAGEPCPTLGEKATGDNGATVFCQRDQRDRSLRWREVIAGGGCVNRTMTGSDVAGVAYHCRVRPDGLNRWVAG